MSQVAAELKQLLEGGLQPNTKRRLRQVNLTCFT